MNRLIVLVTAWFLAIQAVGPAHAASCSSLVDSLKQAERLSLSNPDAGPTAPQSIGAQLGYQPTPGSVVHGEAAAQSEFVARLAHAKALDAAGHHAACMRALAHAREAFVPN